MIRVPVLVLVLGQTNSSRFSFCISFSSSPHFLLLPHLCVFSGSLGGEADIPSMHITHNTQAHTMYTPPNIPHQSSAVTKSIYSAQVTVSSWPGVSAWPLPLSYPDKMWQKKKKNKQIREVECVLQSADPATVELRVSRNLQQQNHSLYELNMSVCAGCICHDAQAEQVQSLRGADW